MGSPPLPFKAQWESLWAATQPLRAKHQDCFEILLAHAMFLRDWTRVSALCGEEAGKLFLQAPPEWWQRAREDLTDEEKEELHTNPEQAPPLLLAPLMFRRETDDEPRLAEGQYWVVATMNEQDEETLEPVFVKRLQDDKVTFQYMLPQGKRGRFE